MKINKILGGLALTALVSAGLSSCSNDVEYYDLNKSTAAALVNKAPKIQAYSGDHYWTMFDTPAAPTATRAEGSLITISDISTTTINQGNESAYLEDYLPEGEDNLSKVDDDFLYYTTGLTEVELYPVYAQTYHHHDVGIFYYDADGQIHEELIWSELNPYNLYKDGVLSGKKIIIPAGVFFGFFIDKGNSIWAPNEYGSASGVNPGKLYSTASMNPGSYPNKEPNVFEADLTKDLIKTHAVTWVRTHEDGTRQNYLGFEDWADFDFQDLVFTLTPEVSTVDASTFEPGTTTPDPEDNCGTCGHPTHEPGQCEQCTPGQYPDCRPEAPEDKCDKCEHPSHGDGPCDQCPDDEGCNEPEDNGNNGNGTPEQPEKPNTPPVVTGDDHTNEVEVNLAVDTKGETSNGKYNESHLSIHVRSAVDVDMFIPMPLEYICPADDMEIVQKHLDGLSDHGGEFENAQYDKDGKVIMEGGLLSKMTYKIADRWDVSVYVEYVDNPEEGIHIWTEGLANNTELFEYLQENYGDGITFEIWNYYDESKSLNELKHYLDQATIDFIGNVLPDFFINAFGSENGKDKDCDVNMVDEKKTQYEEKVTGPHLNGSDLNEIYERTAHKTNQNQPTDPNPGV